MPQVACWPTSIGIGVNLVVHPWVHGNYTEKRTTQITSPYKTQLRQPLQMERVSNCTISGHDRLITHTSSQVPPLVKSLLRQCVPVPACTSDCMNYLSGVVHACIIFAQFLFWRRWFPLLHANHIVHACIYIACIHLFTFQIFWRCAWSCDILIDGRS